MTNKVRNCTVVAILLLHYCISEILGHGMLMEPVNRGSAWRKGFQTPYNFNDNANYCGGFSVQHMQNNGRCGVCGDNYALDQPRPNENGGVYGTGTIVKTLIAGEEFVAIVNITANHMGSFEFSLCPLRDWQDVETEECFQEHPIYLADGNHKYILTSSHVGSYEVKLVMPENVVCDHCSLRWHWTTANNWGICPSGRGELGCGPQETFRTCSDVQVVKPPLIT